MHTAAKKSALLELARRRQTDTVDGYSCKYFHFRDFDCECDHVVPWTISARNVDADLMLIAQDWASEDFLNRLTEVQRQAQRARPHHRQRDAQRNPHCCEHEFHSNLRIRVAAFATAARDLEFL